MTCKVQQPAITRKSHTKCVSSHLQVPSITFDEQNCNWTDKPRNIHLIKERSTSTKEVCKSSKFQNSFPTQHWRRKYRNLGAWFKTNKRTNASNWDLPLWKWLTTWVSRWIAGTHKLNAVQPHKGLVRGAPESIVFHHLTDEGNDTLSACKQKKGKEQQVTIHVQKRRLQIPSLIYSSHMNTAIQIHPKATAESINTYHCYQWKKWP